MESVFNCLCQRKRHPKRRHRLWEWTFNCLLQASHKSFSHLDTAFQHKPFQYQLHITLQLLSSVLQGCYVNGLFLSISVNLHANHNNEKYNPLEIYLSSFFRRRPRCKEFRWVPTLRTSKTPPHKRIKKRLKKQFSSTTRTSWNQHFYFHFLTIFEKKGTHAK